MYFNSRDSSIEIMPLKLNACIIPTTNVFFKKENKEEGDFY